MAEITVSSTQVSPANNSLEIYGSRGTIMESHNGQPPLRVFSQAEEAGDMQYDWDEPEVRHDEFPGYYFISGRNCDDHFAQCLLEGKAFEYTLEDAMSAVECALAGYLSFLEQRPVKREEVLAMAETRSIYDRLEGAIPTKN
jgi:predicted dehydrogenase